MKFKISNPKDPYPTFSRRERGTAWRGTNPLPEAGGTAAPLGSGWYDIGSVTLAAADNSPSVEVAYSGDSPLQICLAGYSDHDYYNAAGELTEQVDRDGRATTYQFDALGRQTSETWYATSDTSGMPTETLTSVYDADGQLLSASDENLMPARPRRTPTPTMPRGMCSPRRSRFRGLRRSSR